MEYAVYVKLNASLYITAVDSSAFVSDTTGWVEIDQGYGGRYGHAQVSYFQKPIRTDGGAYRYKLVDGEPVECTPEEIAAQEEANRPVPAKPDGNVWDEMDAAYQEGVDSV